LQSEHLRSNLSWLERKDPALARRLKAPEEDLRIRVAPARSGAPTLAVGETQIHSSYDPVSEAAKMADLALKSAPSGAAVVLLGLGLGHLALALRERWSGPMAVIEADEGIARAAVNNLGIAALGDATILVGDDAPEILAQIRVFAERAGGWDRIHLVEHPPSIRLHLAFYDAVAAGVRGRAASMEGPLGILVVTPMYGGSLPIARYCASAFERLGHRVETLDNSIFDEARRRIEGISRDRRHRGALEQLLTTLMSEMITARALDRAVDLVWLIAQSPMTIPVSQELKKHGVPTAFWFVEEWLLLTYWQEWAPRFDYFFSIQKGPFLKALSERGVKRARHLPLAADPTVHKPVALTDLERAEFSAEVSHVGAGYRNRRHVFSGLAGFDFKLWGSDWEDPGVLAKVLQRSGARISTADAVKIFNATLVNINLHSSQFHDGVNPEGDYLNPRTYEVAAAGAFQLIDHRSDLADQFEPDREIVEFHDAREMGPLIRYYLDHPDERRRIAEAGRARVLRDHTYDMRMAEALGYIFSYETSRAGKRRPNHIDNLIRQAEGRPDLLELLEEMKGAGVVTLDDIVEHIRRREGELTDAETIFLLMFEFRRWAVEKDLA